MPMRRAFDERTGILSFRVSTGDGHVTAFISRATWQARYGTSGSDASLLDLYLQYQPMIDAIVVRKVRDGVRGPVVVMAGDL